MARKKITADLNGGDAVTAMGDLVFQVHDASDDSIIATANYAAIGSVNTNGTDGANIVYTLNPTGGAGGNGQIILNGVDLGTVLPNSIKIRCKDESGNESILSSSFFVSDYLLDNYANSVAGYSMRKLKLTATNSIEIRRSNDDALTDVILDDTGSLSLSSLVTAGGTLGDWVGSNNALIRTWYDQSGNANDIIQTTDGFQPRIILAGVLYVKDGLSGAKFAGASDRIIGSALGALDGGEQWSSFAVVSSGATELIGTIFTTDDGGGNRIQMFIDSRVASKTFANITTTGDTNTLETASILNNTDNRLYTAFSDGSEYSCFSDSIAGNTATPTTNNPLNTTFNVGTRGSATNPLNGIIQELVIFSEDKSANRTEMETAINDYYTIY